MTLVIIGYPEKDSNEEIVIALNDLSKVYDSIICFSNKYNISSLDLNNNVTIIQENAVRVFSNLYNHAMNKEDSKTLKLSYKATYIFTDHTYTYFYLKDIDSSVTYVCVEKRLCLDEFSLAALVCTSTFTNRKWLITNDTLFKAKIEKAIELPDIFNVLDTSINIINKYNKVQRSNFDFFILNGIDMLRCYLKAGYNLGMNLVEVPNFCLQTTGVWLSLLIGFFKIIPGSIDYTPQEEIMESSDMRKLISSIFIFVLSNFFHKIYPRLVGGKEIITEKFFIKQFSSEESDKLKNNENMFLYEKTYSKNYIVFSMQSTWDYIRKQIV